MLLFSLLSQDRHLFSSRIEILSEILYRTNQSEHSGCVCLSVMHLKLLAILPRSYVQQSDNTTCISAGVFLCSFIYSFALNAHDVLHASTRPASLLLHCFSSRRSVGYLRLSIRVTGEEAMQLSYVHLLLKARPGTRMTDRQTGNERRQQCYDVDRLP